MTVWAIYFLDLDGSWRLDSLWQKESYATYMMEKLGRDYPESPIRKVVEMPVSSISLFDENFYTWEVERETKE